jgi:hypothetical protein
VNAVILLKLASLTYAGLIAAGLLMPRVVGLWEHLQPLPPFIRRLFWVYYGFIGLCLAGFGIGTFVFADDLSSGTPLARAVCAFLAMFWTLRFIAGMWIFDLRPYLTNTWRKAGLFAANVVFTCLPILYGWVALKGGAK